MGKESIYISVEAPKRLLTKEVVTKIIKEFDDSGEPFDIDQVFEHNKETGIVSFDIDEVYDEEPLLDILTKADIPFRLKTSGSLESPSTAYTYTPKTAKKNPGSLKEVILNDHGYSYITTDLLTVLLEEEEKRIKAGNSQHSALYDQLKELVYKNTVDPEGIVEQYCFETELGRNEQAIKSIEDVLTAVDENKLSNQEAMEAIAKIKKESEQVE